MSNPYTKDALTGRFVSAPESIKLPVAKIIHSLPCMDGDAHKIYSPEITSWRQERQCAWCGAVFKVKYPAQKMQRFCGKSCSANWRMSQPEIKAKVHNQEVAARRGISRSRWLRSGNRKALKELERITNLNPSTNPETRKKISLKLQAMKHKPSERGGNGHPMTLPQQIMKDALSGNWIAEYAISLGKRQPSFPTCYKVDLGNPDLKIAIEIDGACHHSRKELDAKKDQKLASLGWTVLRFWNQDILNWKNTGMPMDTYISTILKQNDIHLTASKES